MLFPYSVRGTGLLLDKVSSIFQRRRIPFGRSVIVPACLLTGGILLLAVLYPTRLIQYTVALHDEPELCILYKETIREQVQAVEMQKQERNIEWEEEPYMEQ